MSLKDTIARRLELRKSLDEETGCWIWNGAWNSDGDPVMRVEGKIRLVKHVSAWLYLARPLTATDCVMRRCKGGKLCISPDHMFRISSPKSAARFAARLGMHARGEANGRAKLTQAQALRIIAIVHDPLLTEIDVAAKLAAEFKKPLSPRVVADIRDRRTWKHL